MGIIRLSITPSANRNSYRVAISFYILTQGSVLRPQPWAGKSQLLQSCCWYGAAMALGMAPIKLNQSPTPHPSQLSTTNQSPNPTSITIINPKPITNLASITIIYLKPITQPYIHHNYQPQTNLPTPTSITIINHKPITASIFTPKKTNTDIADLSDILGKCYQANQRYPYFHQYRPRGNRANPYATPEALYRGAPPWRR